MSTRAILSLVTRRTVERNTVRYYSRKRQYPRLSPNAFKSITRTIHRTTSSDHNDTRQFSMQGINQAGFHCQTFDATELQLRRQLILNRLSSTSSGAIGGSGDLDVLFRMWAKQNLPDLSLEEIKDLEAYLNRKITNPSTQIGDIDELVSSTGVLERFQAWAALAYYSKSFQAKIMKDEH